MILKFFFLILTRYFPDLVISIVAIWNSFWSQIGLTSYCVVLFSFKEWRWGWDSNPRNACTFAGFQDRSLSLTAFPNYLNWQQLGQLVVKIQFYHTCNSMKIIIWDINWSQIGHKLSFFLNILNKAREGHTPYQKNITIMLNIYWIEK